VAAESRWRGAPGVVYVRSDAALVFQLDKVTHEVDDLVELLDRRPGPRG